VDLFLKIAFDTR